MTDYANVCLRQIPLYFMLLIFTNRLNKLIFLGPEGSLIKTKMISRQMFVQVDWKRSKTNVEDDEKRFLFCFFITSFER